MQIKKSLKVLSGTRKSGTRKEVLGTRKSGTRKSAIRHPALRIGTIKKTLPHEETKRSREWFLIFYFRNTKDLSSNSGRFLKYSPVQPE